jgi:hypothetical protein
MNAMGGKPQGSAWRRDRSAKAFVADFEKLAGRLKGSLSRWSDGSAVKGLDRMNESRAVTLPENVRPDFQDVIGTHAQKMLVESRMMKLAQGKSIADHRLSLRFRIGNDVGRVQKLLVPEPAKGALAAIGVQHPLAESPLMETLADGRRDIDPGGNWGHS